MSRRPPNQDDVSSASHKMWGGRFSAAPNEALETLNNSLPIDQRLWPHDIRVNKAWVVALERASVLSPAERKTLESGLEHVAGLLEQGAAVDAPDEDIHTLVERLLYEEVGEVAGKLHTGRSRNDQVATDLRLWCCDAISALDEEICALARVLVSQARHGIDMVMPGYTHGQQAQPVRWGYVLLAHTWPLVRDRQLLQTVKGRTSVMPLGSGALAGSGVAVDRELLREILGFDSVSQNALDATGDRDFVADFLYALAMIGTHASRLAAELVIYSSSECGFVRLSDAFSTGSSLMPQKRNPDVFELVRSKAARTLGDLVALLGTLRGLPAGYSKDLQEDKASLFDAVDTAMITLPAFRGAVGTLEPIPARMEGALQDGLMATDIADDLVVRGMPFREAHGVVGRLVAAAEEQRVSLSKVSREKAAEVHEALPDILDGLGSFAESVDRRVTQGGTSHASVMAQLAALDKELARV